MLPAILALRLHWEHAGADQQWKALELMSRSIGWVLTADEIVDRLGLSGQERTELVDATTGGN